MRHLSFVEFQMLRHGGTIPWRIRLHLLLCKSCRDEWETQEGDFLNEFRQHYLDEENTQPMSSPENKGGMIL